MEHKIQTVENSEEFCNCEHYEFLSWNVGFRNPFFPKPRKWRREPGQTHCEFCGERIGP